jgi:hypothetical protein
MEMERVRVRTAGLRIGAGRVVIMRVRMSSAGTFMRVKLSLPEPGEQQAKQRNAEQQPRAPQLGNSIADSALKRGHLFRVPQSVDRGKPRAFSQTRATAIQEKATH